MKFYGTAHNAKTKLALEGERHMVSIKEWTKRIRWGRWYVDHKKPVSLNIMLTPWYEYWIDLSRCQTARARELWLEHMAEKTLVVNSRDVSAMARAFNDLVHQGILKP